MEKIEEESRKNYLENLKAEDLYELKLHVVKEMPDNMFKPLEVFHDIMKSGRFKGNRLLEIGSGTTVHSIASASAYFSEIVQSDLLEVNLAELRKWHRGESKQDWSFLLKITAHHEGYKDLDEGCKQIENRIRRCVKAIVKCDVLLDELIPPGIPAEYDLVIATNCLECAATSFESFVSVLKRISRLLRPGGGLIMLGYLNGAAIWKTLKGVPFNYLTVTQADIDEALDRAGFVEKEWIVIPQKNELSWFSCDASYIVASRKM